MVLEQNPTARQRQLAKRLQAAHAQGLLTLRTPDDAVSVAIGIDDELTTSAPFNGFRIVDWLISCPEIERVDADDATLGALLLP